MSNIRRRTSSQILRRSGLQRRNKRPLRFEPLEQRAMLIVGAVGLAPPTPLDEFTGVVHLAGDAASFPTAPRCSATLLESGRHLLTAGHCVVQNEEQEIILVQQDPQQPILGT